jgi:hypothetical protein
MGNARAGEWRYTARYGWDWRSARAISKALGSLALPMPPWFRAVVARGLLARTALHADEEGIWGSAAAPAGSAGPCPCRWKDVTAVVVWDYDYLRIIGIVHPGDMVGAGPAARALVPKQPRRSTRRRAFLRHPGYPAFIAPDGSPYDGANVLTANGWGVDIVRLQSTVRHFAPRAQFVNLSGVNAAPESGGPVEFAVEVIAGLFELIGWRRLGWLLGIAASAAVLAVAAANLGTQSHAPIGVTVGALGLALFLWRAVAVRRRRRRAAHPESWLESGREDAERSPLSGLRRGRLAAWMLRARSRVGWRGRRGMGPSRRRSAYAIRRRR